MHNNFIHTSKNLVPGYYNMIWIWIDELLEWMPRVWKDFLEMTEKIIFRLKGVKYDEMNTMEMRKHIPNPNIKEKKSYFGTDETRKDQGVIQKEKAMGLLNETFRPTLQWGDKKPKYYPETEKDSCLDMHKDKIDDHSPGSSIVKGTYYASKCAKIEQYPQSLRREWLSYYTQKIRRDTLEGTDDTGTKDYFSGDPVDSTGYIGGDKNTKSPKGSKKWFK